MKFRKSILAAGAATLLGIGTHSWSAEVADAGPDNASAQTQPASSHPGSVALYASCRYEGNYAVSGNALLECKGLKWAVPDHESTVAQVPGAPAAGATDVEIDITVNPSKGKP